MKNYTSSVQDTSSFNTKKNKNSQNLKKVKNSYSNVYSLKSKKRRKSRENSKYAEGGYIGYQRTYQTNLPR